MFRASGLAVLGGAIGKVASLGRDVVFVLVRRTLCRTDGSGPMRGSLQSIVDAFVSIAVRNIGPKTSAAVCTGAVLSTAYTLGATWLGASVLGVPLGLWGLLGVVVGAHVYATRKGALHDATESSANDLQDVVQLRPWRKTAGSAVQSSATHEQSSRESIEAAASRLVDASTRQLDSARRGIEALTQRILPNTLGLNVGLDLPQREFESFVTHTREKLDNIAGVPIAWTRAEPGLMCDGNENAAKYDALLRRGTDGRLVLFVHESQDSGAGWSDWSNPQPLSYPSVFPARLDTSHTDLGSIDLSETGSAKLVGAIAMTAAILRRSPVRLGAKRVLGGATTLPDAPLVLAAAMNALGDSVVGRRAAPGEACAAERTAARVLSAYVATVGRDLPSGCRTALAQAALDAVPTEPELSLRLGATQIGECEVQEGKRTLVRAIRQLRIHGIACESDSLAFVMSEAEHGAGDRSTLGRICAGLALAWGTAPNKSIDYLREDLIDDLKASGWLAGREQDVAVLREVIAELERELFAAIAAVTDQQPAESAAGSGETAAIAGKVRPKAPVKKPTRKRKAA